MDEEIAIEPSPTADATRLILPPRTSPTANTRADWFQEDEELGQRPMRGGQIVLRQIGSRLDESFGFECETATKPLCTGNRTRHDKNMPDVVSLDGAGLMVPPAHRFEMATPF